MVIGNGGVSFSGFISILGFLLTIFVLVCAGFDTKIVIEYLVALESFVFL